LGRLGLQGQHLSQIRAASAVDLGPQQGHRAFQGLQRVTRSALRQ
jgi:hypothetical protein